jgi:hypothetical protein
MTLLFWFTLALVSAPAVALAAPQIPEDFRGTWCVDRELTAGVASGAERKRGRLPRTIMSNLRSRAVRRPAVLMIAKGQRQHPRRLLPSASACCSH